MLAPAVANDTGAVFTSVSDACQDLVLPPAIQLQDLLMRTPDHSHARPSTGFDAWNAVFENQTLFWHDLRFAFGTEVCIDGLERDEVDVWARLPSPWGDARIVAQDTPVRRECGKEGFLV